MTIKRVKQVSNSQQGVSIVEFAVVLPVLVLIISGIIDFGLAMRHVLAVSDATRYATKQAALSIYSDSHSNMKRSRAEYCSTLRDTAERAVRAQLGSDGSVPQIELLPQIFDNATLSQYVRNPARKAPRETQLIRVSVKEEAKCFFCFGEILVRRLIGNESVAALDEPCLRGEFGDRIDG